MQTQELTWRTDQPKESIKEPILTRRNSPFKFGLQYKVRKSELDETLVWKLAPEVEMWAEITV